jgi:hypothetical protein
MDPFETPPSTAVRTANPYRDARDVLGDRVKVLEKENASLRSFAAFLVFLSTLLALVAAWWFTVLWSMTK